jgi:predicted kinase
MNRVCTPKQHPVRFTIIHGENAGKVVAVRWFAFAADIWDDVEAIGARMAEEWDAEIDIETGSVMPSGRVATWERAGMRCVPVR